MEAMMMLYPYLLFDLLLSLSVLVKRNWFRKGSNWKW